jgi:hypothetical protein
MSRSNGYAITGNELQAMVNEHLLLAKGSIPATDRCLTNAEVYNGAYVYLGDAPSGTFLPTHDLGGGTFGASPNWLANFTNINPVGSQSVLFEMSQYTSPYLNVDLGGYVNGVALRLDPANNLDYLFFGSPQYSPNMKQYIDVGNILAIQANFGRNDEESPGNWGWQGGGYGVLEIYQNDVLVSVQNTPWRPASTSANASSLTYTLTVQPNVDYYVKAYAVYGLNNVINNCGYQSTMYVEPYPTNPGSTVEQDFYVGPGPALLHLRSLYARRYFGPGQYPSNGPTSLNGQTNPWWVGHVTVGTSNLILDEEGSTYYGGAFPNLTPPATYDNYWTFIPEGEDTIKIKLYGGSTDSTWEVSSYIGCAEQGSLMDLHWSPDTAANACDPNYSYHYFDGSEVTIDGFTGYKQYLVVGGFQVGGKISVYPSGTGTISNYTVGGISTGGNLHNSNGMTAYMFSDYASSYGGAFATKNTINPFVQPGYYSNGTNWALVGDSMSTTGYNNGVIVEVGICSTCKRYAITDQFMPA